jgi:hypothetical protein
MARRKLVLGVESCSQMGCCARPVLIGVYRSIEHGRDIVTPSGIQMETANTNVDLHSKGRFLLAHVRFHQVIELAQKLPDVGLRHLFLLRLAARLDSHCSTFRMESRLDFG